MNLTEYARNQQHATKCQTCSLPAAVLKEVNGARSDAREISYQTIANWLDTKGHKLSMHAVRNHFQAGHHVKTGQQDD